MDSARAGAPAPGRRTRRPADLLENMRLAGGTRKSYAELRASPSWGAGIADGCGGFTSGAAGGGGGAGLAESPVAHLPPAAAPADEVEEGLHLEEGEELAEAEVLPDRVPDEAGQILPAGVAAEGDLLEQNGGDGEE